MLASPRFLFRLEKQTPTVLKAANTTPDGVTPNAPGVALPSDSDEVVANILIDLAQRANPETRRAWEDARAAAHLLSGYLTWASSAPA